MSALMRQAVALLLASLLVGNAAAAEARDPAQLERRLQSVATLIERSSVARQIEASGDPLAAEARARARVLHREATAAAAAGDAQRASRLLDDATRQMVQAARSAAPEQVTGDKARSDFEARLRSVESLLDAQRRIAQEKPQFAADAEQSIRRARQHVSEAKSLAAAKDLAGARATIDQAYLTTKVALESMRRGDTLVRSLHFATKREEYEYEIDRNDTHRMLAQVLLKDKRASNPMLERSVQPYLEQAARLRAQAEQRAGDGDHDGAIALLEDSTRQFVRAIRSSGVYIPG
ncbi:MAG: hypothetical protein JSW68_08945 [Burkholderiales bacterium]|nr:MAG: hypothetical protein JSW68_08945 [Burkholderiales bacterium]